MDNGTLLIASYEKGPPAQLTIQRLSDLPATARKKAIAVTANLPNLFGEHSVKETMKTPKAASVKAASVKPKALTVKAASIKGPTIKAVSAKKAATPKPPSVKAASVKAVSVKKAATPKPPTIKAPTVKAASVKKAATPKPLTVKATSIKKTLKAPASANESKKKSLNEKPAFLSDKRWSDFPLDPRTLKALTQTMGYEYMSKIQAETLPIALEGIDIAAKAKTGTGKTVGFLVPVIERLAVNPPPSGKIGALIVSHNRDLARQIHSEAEKVLTFHDMKAQVVIGGSNIGGEQKRMREGRCDILIGTPGRLVDHIENTPNFRDMLAGVRIFVLDEADQMLDQGFKKALDTIIGAIPKVHQTLLFTATVPDSVKTVMKEYLGPDYKYIDTVGEEESQVHAKIPQEYVIVPIASVFPAMQHILAHQVATNPLTKAIVFFPTARQAQFSAELFTAAGGFPAGVAILEMHSRLSQPARNRTYEAFKAAKTAVMFSSDVSARGVDYPGVTLVLQVGVPDTVASYIHRVGRTGRAGAAGVGILLLSDKEERFIDELHKGGVPIQPAKADSIITGALASGTTVPPSTALAGVFAKLSDTRDLRQSARQSYSAWLGYYKGHIKKLGWTKEQLAEYAAAFFTAVGLKELPALSAKTLGKMGLRGVKGIREAGVGDVADEDDSAAVGGTRKRRIPGRKQKSRHRWFGM